MNIFTVDESPTQSARDLCNKHVVKMCVETAQILSTAMHLSGIEGPYRSTHKKHPSVLWTLESANNAAWLFEHGMELLEEYTRRYKKIHATSKAMDVIANRWSSHLSSGTPSKHTPFAQCMPDAYKDSDPIVAYRRYYVNDKARFAVWEPLASEPLWWKFK